MKKEKRKEIFKTLYVLKDVWFHDVPCFIDCIHSGECYVGKGDLRIIPHDRKIHTSFGDKRIIAGDGSWINLDNENLTLIAPPELITWKNTKGSRTEEFDFNKAKTIGNLLSKGKVLLLKNSDTIQTLVEINNGEIKTKKYNTKCNSIMAEYIKGHMLSNDSSKEWFLI